MFSKLVPLIVIDYYMRFKLFKKQSNENMSDWYAQRKRWFVEITKENLVWKQSI